MFANFLGWFSRVVEALNQAAKPWKPIFRSIGTICGFWVEIPFPKDPGMSQESGISPSILL